ncbi:MAG: response regulator transcription factor [Kiritimatiellae bacterium]|nr:response regulator transcription factor [Kiritimatiellia bacterium]
MKKRKVLLVDDHSLVRLGLAALIGYQNDLEVAGEAEDGVEAVQAASRINPDIVVMDLMMPCMDGVEATRQIRANLPKARILILTTFGTSADVMRAIAAGASGAIMKDSSNDELLNAIRTVADGGRAFSPEIEHHAKEYPLPPELTQRQMEILHSVTRGLSNPDIAKQFDITVDGVKAHLNAIFKKLGAANRSEAITIALRRHLLKL